jgi:periplasmic protein TonB
MSEPMDRPTSRSVLPARPSGAQARPASGPRPTLPMRRDHERRQARRRIAARVTRPLGPEQQAFDPLARDPRTGRRRLFVGLLAVLASVGLHVGVVGGGLGWHRLHPAAPARDQVRIEVRERPPEAKPEPPPPPPPPVVPPPREVPPPVMKRPRVVEAALPPPEAPRPRETPRAKPVRVVGLSLDSTGAEGNGPAFAVGNTRMGDTDRKAVAPEAVAPPSAEAPPVAAPSGPAATNQIATRIPVAGVKYVLPGRKHPRKPPYPPTLKSQGLEADVMVMVNVGATGKVLSARVIKASPYPEFNEAARKAALDEEFEPATRDGVPIAYPLSYTYRFRLEDE